MKKPWIAKLLRVLILIVLIAAVIAAILLAVNHLLPNIIKLVETGDYDALEDYIRGFGNIYGIMVAYVLLFLQIASVFFPGSPIVITIGIVFGVLEGFVICVSGYILSNMLVFSLARRIRSGLDNYIPVETGKKSKFNFILESQSPAFMIMLGCMIPIIPNGLVPYIAAQAKLSFRSFFIATFLGCLPRLFILCLIGNKILERDFTYAIVLFILYFAIIIVLYLFRDKLIARLRKFM